MKGEEQGNGISSRCEKSAKDGGYRVAEGTRLTEDKADGYENRNCSENYGNGLLDDADISSFFIVAVSL